MLADNFRLDAEDEPQVIFFWGVAGIDKSGFNNFNSSHTGKI